MHACAREAAQCFKTSVRIQVRTQLEGTRTSPASQVVPELPTDTFNRSTTHDALAAGATTVHELLFRKCRNKLFTRDARRGALAQSLSPYLRKVSSDCMGWDSRMEATAHSSVLQKRAVEMETRILAKSHLILQSPGVSKPIWLKFLSKSKSSK